MPDGRKCWAGNAVRQVGDSWRSSCLILTSPADCSDNSWRDTFLWEAWTRRSVTSDMQHHKKHLLTGVISVLSHRCFGTVAWSAKRLAPTIKGCTCGGDPTQSGAVPQKGQLDTERAGAFSFASLAWQNKMAVSLLCMYTKQSVLIFLMTTDQQRRQQQSADTTMRACSVNL